MMQRDIAWEIDIPLITNPNMVGAWLKAMVATFVVVMVIMGAVFVGTGQAESLPMVAGIFALVTGGLAIVGLLIMLLVFGNRYRARFEITDTGISVITVDRRARALSRLAVLAGGMSGSAAAAGAGLVAVSGETAVLRWKSVSAARYLPRRQTIVLRNSWRDLMHVYCTTDNFEVVRARVAQVVAQADAGPHTQGRRSPLPAVLGQSALVVVASLPLFALDEVLDLDIFVPLLIMLFSLATLWLIPLFGWVVLPAALYVAVRVASNLLELREYTLVSTYRYRRYEVIDPGEWVILGLALAGLAYLAWLAWRALRGRQVPLLLRDHQDPGD